MQVESLRDELLAVGGLVGRLGVSEQLLLIDSDDEELLEQVGVSLVRLGGGRSA
jgi:hypothetical protein